MLAKLVMSLSTEMDKSQFSLNGGEHLQIRMALMVIPFQHDTDLWA